MLRATKDIKLPTTITGSLPRPSWYTENLGRRSFMEAMVNSTYREQYTDTVAVYLHEQEIAGLDIVTDGDAHFDQDVGGQSWTNYPTRHMKGFDHNDPRPTPGRQGRPRVPAGPHPARLSGGSRDAQHRWAGRPRRPAVRGDVEGRAAHDRASRSSSAPSGPSWSLSPSPTATIPA